MIHHACHFYSAPVAMASVLKLLAAMLLAATISGVSAGCARRCTTVVRLGRAVEARCAAH